jgi:hypothetical protein
MSDTPHDPRLDAALRAGRSVVVPGFAERAVAAVRRDRARRRTLRWVAVTAPLAACLVALLAIPAVTSPADAELARLVALVGELEVGVPHLDDSEGLARLATWGN